MSKPNFLTYKHLLIGAALSIGTIGSTAQASQYVSDVTPSATEDKEETRQLDNQVKMVSRNLYGADADIYIMFKQSGSPVDFNKNYLAFNVNIDGSNPNDIEVACSPALSGSVGPSQDYTKTNLCTFSPKILMGKEHSGSAATLDEVRDYLMRIKFEQAANRDVVLFYSQPIEPQCDDSGAPNYNPMATCTSATSTITWNNGNIVKPSVTHNSLQWTPLVVRNQKYKVTLDVRKGNVRVVHGIKVKVSGERFADQNDELLDGFKFDSCDFKDDAILAPTSGVDPSCTFTAQTTGFVHIPLKRSGSGERKVITTIENITP